MVVGPCTFPPFERRSISKTNSEKRKSNSRFSFWYFHSKTKSGSQFPLFVLVLPLQNEKRKSTCRFSFWYFHSKTKSGGQLFAFRFGTSTPKRKAEVNFPLFVFTPKRIAEVIFPLLVLALPLQNEKR